MCENDPNQVSCVAGTQLFHDARPMDLDGSRADAQITHRPVVQVDEFAALPGPLAPGGEDLAEGGEGAGQRGLRGVVERYVGHGTALERVEF